MLAKSSRLVAMILSALVWGDGVGEAVDGVGAVNFVAAGFVGGGGGDVAQAAVGVAQEDGVGGWASVLHGQADFHERFAGDANQRHVAKAQGLHGAFHLAVHQRRGQVGKRLVRPCHVCGWAAAPSQRSSKSVADAAASMGLGGADVAPLKRFGRSVGTECFCSFTGRASAPSAVYTRSASIPSTFPG